MEKEIAGLLLQIKAIKLNPQNPFTWASGIKSPIYCDNRKTLSYPAVRNSIKAALALKSKDFGDFDVVAGVATAGIPHGALLADALGKPFIYIRTKAKEHGLKNLIEGEMPEGANVLVVEDLISTGGSSLKAVESVRESGGNVVGVIAIFTYEFPDADEAFAEQNCNFKTLTNYHSLIEEALASGYIQEEQVALLKEWRLNRETWSV